MNTLKTLTAWFLTAATALASTVSPAIDNSAYSHDADNGARNPQWMSSLPDSRKFSELSVPGTHDTMALYGGDYAQAQSMSLAKQLDAGIRALDIRCRHYENTFQIYHGFVYQFASFETVLDAVQQFLNQNPRETVYMYIQSETTDITPAKGNTRSFAETFDDYKSRYPGLFWEYTGENPTLGETRGKVVVIQNFYHSPAVGLDYDRFVKRDNDWKVSTNWKLYDKWTSVKSQLQLAATASTDTVFSIGLNGAEIAFPYFVASGHSSPGTNAPQLMTGLTTPGWKDWYPDFPRVNCVLGICSIAFLGTNQLTNLWLLTQRMTVDLLNMDPRNKDRERIPYPRVGLIWADFPGRSLIENIIALNRR
ncbi:phosphatidylinositol-specific phospholipase C domain-containing protein [Methylocaldum sp. BRCS4]|nr:phosphatidylinositol-specific phospholipase C domain-containing protein [Methylocaldum sp. BRCS4]